MHMPMLNSWLLRILNCSLFCVAGNPCTTAPSDACQQDTSLLHYTLCLSLKQCRRLLNGPCSIYELSVHTRAADEYLPSDAVQVQGEQQCPAAESRTGQSCFASCMARTNHHHSVAVLCISVAERGCCRLERPLNAPGRLPLCGFAPCLSFLLQRDNPNAIRRCLAINLDRHYNIQVWQHHWKLFRDSSTISQE